MGVNGNRRRVSAVGIVLLGVVAAWGVLQGTGVRAEEATRYAAAMPRGALVYLEARDLAGGLKAWLASPMRDRYYTSASYRSFTRSKLYLKLQGRLADLQKGFGVELTEARLAQFAGGPSAVAIYDPGKLELLFVTEVPREQAGVAALLAQTRNFQERRTPKGALYYAREVTTDGGSLTQQIAVAHAGGRLWLTTSAALLVDALDGVADGGLGASVAETVRQAPDFRPHDVVIWIDQEKVSRNKYFNLYWIHRNAPDLAGIRSGLIDVEFAPDAVRERRWFVMGEPARMVAGPAASLERLRSLAPADAHLVEASAGDGQLGPVLAETLFGPDRHATARASVQVAGDSDLATNNDEDDGARPKAGRYQHLDERFERDVDDPALAAAKPAVTRAPADRPFAEQLAAVLAPAAPVRYATYGSIDLPQGELFARFRRGVVVELESADRFDPRAFEALVGTEVGRRLVVGGDGSKAAWADVGGARAIASALVPQGGAYRVSGRFLIVARDGAECAGIAERAAAASSEPQGAGAVARTAEVRLGAGRESFARLTRV